jgi:hypothetical protein
MVILHLSRCVDGAANIAETTGRAGRGRALDFDDGYSNLIFFY